MGYENDIYRQVAKLWLHPEQTIEEGLKGINQFAGDTGLQTAADVANPLGAAADYVGNKVATGVSEAVTQQEALETGEAAKQKAIAGKTNDIQRYSPKDFQTQPSDVTAEDVAIGDNFDAKVAASQPHAILKAGGKEYDYTGGKGNYFGGPEAFKKVADAMPPVASQNLQGFGKNFTVHGGQASATPGLDDFQRDQALSDLTKDSAIAEKKSQLDWNTLPELERRKAVTALERSKNPIAVASDEAGSINLETPPADYISKELMALKTAMTMAKVPVPADALLVKQIVDQFRKEHGNLATALNKGRGLEFTPGQ